MKSYVSRFLHHTMSHSDTKPQSTSMLSPSGLTRWSRSNQVANLSHLDCRIKPDNDSLYAGRSMVEMLGVLAIIGVLSVGAIAGYSKAMMKYKLNKQAEQLNTIISVGARYSHAFSATDHIQPTLIKAGEIPSEMIKSNNEIYDIFNIKYQFSYASGATTGPALVVFAYPDLSKNSAETFDICCNIVIAAKEARDNLAYISTDSGYGTSNHRVFGYYGDKYCTGDRTCLRNLTMDNIYTLCTNHIGAEETVITYVFD
jgi:Tfp pilus assembly protein PilE